MAARAHAHPNSIRPRPHSALLHSSRAEEERPSKQHPPLASSSHDSPSSAQLFALLQVLLCVRPSVCGVGAQSFPLFAKSYAQGHRPSSRRNTSNDTRSERNGSGKRCNARLTHTPTSQLRLASAAFRTNRELEHSQNRARLLPQPLFYPLINQHSAIKKADQRSLYFSTTKAPSLFEIPTTAHQH